MAISLDRIFYKIGDAQLMREDYLVMFQNNKIRLKLDIFWTTTAFSGL